MNELSVFTDLHRQFIAIALSLPRLGAAFLILPLFQQSTVPATVRNSLIVALAISVLPAAISSTKAADLMLLDWPIIVLKECLIGAVIGFLFGSVFWALGVAGSMIDMQSGGSMASIVDPIQGHQTALIGQLFSRFASWLLMASGGFLVFMELVLSSYRIWPIADALPQLSIESSDLFIAEFGYILKTGLILAGPAIVVLMAIDAGFGLMNRFAQNLNLFSISSSVKYFAGIGVTFLVLTLYTEFVLKKLGENINIIHELQALF
ncbi:Type III secretory pathway protein [gamma proteobacterium HdN1]|nr:Type III secretory pathway protein [gamma proteobacterium HdN1]